MNMKLKKALTFDERLSRGALTFVNDPGLTDQSHVKSCDINTIMASYEKTGLVPVTANAVPSFEDFSEVVDYHSALNLVISAQEQFASLPASIRSAYENDPAHFLAALEDPLQRQRLIDLGVFSENLPSPIGEGSSTALAPDGGSSA